MVNGQEPWTYDGRIYRLTLASDVSNRDGLALELDDIGPASGRGLALEVFRDDGANGRLTLSAHVRDPLPLELVERFIAESRRQLGAGDV